MPDTGFTVYLRNQLLDQVYGATVYLSVHSGAPGQLGLNEASGSGYARAAVTADGAASAGQVDFPAATTDITVPSGTWTHWGVWDAVSGGNLLDRGTLTPSRTTSSGDVLRFNSGNLHSNLDES